MFKMHLRQSIFRYSGCGPFAKSKERIQKVKEKKDSNIFIETY